MKYKLSVRAIDLTIDRKIYLLKLEADKCYAIAEIAPLLEDGFGLDFYKFYQANTNINTLSINDKLKIYSLYLDELQHLIDKINSLDLAESDWINFADVDLINFFQLLGINLGSNPAFVFALETIAYQLKTGKFLFFESLFATKNQSISVNLMVPNNSNLELELSNAITNNIHCLKIKLTDDCADKLKLLIQFQNKFPDIKIRLDFAQFKLTKEVIKILADLKLEYLETNLENRIENHKFALDQELLPSYNSSYKRIYNSHEKEELISKHKPDILVIKPTNLGGIYQTKEWLKLAQKYNLKVVITSTMESILTHLRLLDFVSLLMTKPELKNHILDSHGFSTYNTYPLWLPDSFINFSASSLSLKKQPSNIDFS